VKEFTGYDVGAVPPVRHKMQIRTFIDEKVMTFDKVIGGGGEINKLLEISPAEIRRLTMGEVKDISAYNKTYHGFRARVSALGSYSQTVCCR